MDDMYAVGILIIVCMLVIFIGRMKKFGDFVVSFLIRAALGLISIYFCNEACAYFHMERIMVGINFLSGLTCGILGFPGVVLLYGIMALKFL